MTSQKRRRAKNPAAPPSLRPQKSPANSRTTTSGGGWLKILASGDADWILTLLLFLITLLAYQPVWHAGFIWDDDAHVTPGNLTSLDGLEKIWTHLGTTQQYYPFVYSVFWAAHKIWGEAPLGYHLLNVLLHFGSALMLVRILRFLQVPGAWLAAGMFALYPTQVESVAWVSELKNTLSGVFYLSAALAYLKFDRDRKWTLYTLALGFFALGLLSKTVIATMPGALLLIFWWKRGRIELKRDVIPLVTFVAAGLAAGLVTSFVERKLLHAEGAEFPFTFVERCLIAGRDIWFYLGKLVWPVDLAFFYPRWNVSQAVWWQYLFPIAAAGLVGLLVWKKWRGPLVALLFFIGTLFPALGFFNVFPFRYSFVADHFQYLACLGPIVLLAAGLTTLFGRTRTAIPQAQIFCCGAILLTLAALTFRQAGVYRDSDTLWAHTYRLNPHCWMAHNYAGFKLYEQERYDEAIAQFNTALEMNPHDVTTRDNLGLALMQKGDVEAATAEFKQSLEIDPESPETFNDMAAVLRQQGNLDEAIAYAEKAVRAKAVYAAAHFNLALCLSDKGDTTGAIGHYERAVTINPQFVRARNNLGTLLLKTGRTNDAIFQFQEAIRADPNFAPARVNLGLAWVNTGRSSEAENQFQKALESKPDDADAHFNLGNILAQRGDSANAMVHFDRALAVNSNYTEAHINYANVLLRLDKTDEAIAHLERALQLSPNNAQAQNNLGNAEGKRGRPAEAAKHYEEAVRLKPGEPSYENNLAWLLATSADASVRNGSKAVELASLANATTGGNNALILHTLAASLAEAGRFPEASSIGERAVALAQKQGNIGLVTALQSELKLYQQRQPFHAASANR